MFGPRLLRSHLQQLKYVRVQSTNRVNPDNECRLQIVRGWFDDRELQTHLATALCYREQKVPFERFLEVFGHAIKSKRANMYVVIGFSSATWR